MTVGRLRAVEITEIAEATDACHVVLARLGQECADAAAQRR